MIAAELNEQLWWYVSRSSGFVSWATVTLSVLWGLALSTKLMGKKAPPAWLLSVHRFLGALGIIFIAVHLIGLVGDSYIEFGWAELFVPMASTWQPGAVAWGIVAFYFLIAVEITSLVMNRIPRRFWRWIHFTSLLCMSWPPFTRSRPALMYPTRYFGTPHWPRCSWCCS